VIRTAWANSLISITGRYSWLF